MRHKTKPPEPTWLTELVQPVSDRLTKQEFARAVKVSTPTVGRWIERGKLETVEFAGRRFITRETVSRFLARIGQAAPSNEPPHAASA